MGLLERGIARFIGLELKTLALGKENKHFLQDEPLIFLHPDCAT